MKKYFAYTRVSTVKQGTKGVSLQEQKAAITFHAQRNGLHISEWFEETVTAAKTGRAVFTNILKRLQSGDAHGLIIHKIDRSARNLKDWAQLADLIDAGVDVQIASGNYDLSSRGGRLSADIQAVVAADYIRNLREETLKGMRGRLKQGLYPLKAPVGYVDNGQGAVKTIDPIQGPLIQKTFDLYTSGTHSIRMLADAMYEMGLRSHRGGRLCKNGISRILNNPFYHGTIRIKTTGEIYKGIHEPLISKAQFNYAQDILSGKYKVKIRTHDYAFKRTFKCSECGYSFIGERQKGHVYYRCHTKTCPMKTIREDRLVQEIDQALRCISISDCLLITLRHALEDTKTHNAEFHEKQIESLSLQLAKAKSKADRLMDLFIDGKIDDPAFNRKQELLHEEIELIESNLSDSHNHVGQILKSIEQFLELAESLISGYKTAPERFRGDLLKTVTSNPTISPTGVDMPIDLPWSLFVSASSGAYCGHLRDGDRTDITQIAIDVFEQLKDHFQGIG